MRSLGDHSWLNDYIGIPYHPMGRDFDAIDCYGLCKLIYHDIYGIDLPDWQEDIHELRLRGQKIHNVIHNGDWTPLNEPNEGCFVVCHGHRLSYHIGLYFAGGVIHAYESSGVIYEPLHRFQMRFGEVSYGEWNP